MTEPTAGDRRAGHTKLVVLPLVHAAEWLDRSPDPADRKDAGVLRRVAARSRLRLERRIGAERQVKRGD